MPNYNTDEQFQKDADKVKNKAQNAAKKAGKKLANKAKQALKKAAKAALKAAKEASKTSLKTVLWANPITWIVVAIIVLIFLGIFVIWCVTEDDVDNAKIATNATYSESYAETLELVSTAFYQKYSDQSFYFYLQEPTESEETAEVDYSGKTYEELNGIKSKGLTQSSYKNYIEDIDGYEDVVKIHYATLAVLDAELNGAGTSDGAYNPEQLIKMVYTGEECNIDSEDFDSEKWACVTEKESVSCEVDEEGKLTDDAKKAGCSLSNKPEDSTTWEEEDVSVRATLKLGDLTEAQSTKYELQDDETYSRTEETETSTADYGLGSIVHYKAYFQPSRVTDYEIKTITYVDTDWKYDDGGSPIVSTTWKSLDADTQENIMTTFKYDGSDSGDMRLTKTEGTNKTGLYEVEDQIVYKDWIKLADTCGNGDYSSCYSNWDEWGTDEPGISTGLYDTEVVYAITDAITYAGKLNAKVIQKWTDLSTATHSQDGVYFKDYTTSKDTTFNNTDTVDSLGYDSVGYKKLYGPNGLLGYISGSANNVRWIEKKVNDEGGKNVPDYEWVSAHSSKNDTYCDNNYNATPTQNTNCKNVGHTIQNGTKTVYTISYTPGYWRATLVRDKDGNLNTQITEIGKEETKTCNECTYEEYKKIKDEADNENKESSKYTWYWTPSYKFIVSAEAEGTFQIKLVSHSASSTTNVEGTEYLKDYIDNYESYVPNKSTTFGCYTGTTSSFVENSSVGIGDYDSLSTCSDKNYKYSISSSNLARMTTFNFDSMSQEQIDVFNKILQYSKESNTSDIEMDDEGIEVAENFSSDYTAKLITLKTTYRDALKKAEAKYGIDQNVLVLLLYASDSLNTKNIVNLKCDATNGCQYEKIDIFDNAKGKQSKTVTVSSGGTSTTLIMNAAAKLQYLLKKYNGNLPLAILDYDIGTEGVKKVLEQYEKISGVSYSQAVADIYEVGWAHFITAGIKKAESDGIAINDSANGSFTKAFFKNMKISNITWRHRITLVFTVTNVKTWKRTSMTDKISNSVKLGKESPEKTKMLYYLTTNDYENYKKYWSFLVSGQKKWDDLYIPEGEENPVGTYHENIKGPENNAKKISLQISDSYVEDIMQKALLIAGDMSYKEASQLSSDYLLQKIGNSEIVTIEPDFKSYIGSNLATPAKEYKTVETSSGYGENYVWTIEVEEGEDIMSITDGEISEVNSDGVIVYIKKKGAQISYDGLKDIEVEKGDDASKQALGKSKGEVRITVYIDGEYYSMKSFMDQYVAAQNSSSSAFASMFTGSFGSYAGKLVLNPDELWSVINQTSVTGAISTQCTMFTNFMMETYWGISGVGINGNGNIKVERIKEVLGDQVGSISNDLSDFGDTAYNLAFSWDDGEYGHTGWINEYNRDEGYIIVSQGNVCNGGIQWKYKYSLEEWESVAGDAITYITLADGNYNTVSDSEIFQGFDVINESETAETKY